MSEIVSLIDEHNQSDSEQKRLFLQDVIQGLNKTKKNIASKYFYDDRGSLLFNEITRHPDYYLTQCEINILNANKSYLSQLMVNKQFNLIELGPGEGIKSNLLIQEFLKDHLQFYYFPIDISLKYLQHLQTVLAKREKRVNLCCLHADYLQGLKWILDHSPDTNLVLFLGSSIGNFDFNHAQQFIHALWQLLKHQDYVLIGFDLRKDINTLLCAYNDSAGITREFNLNLLRRINNELSADFNLENFFHHPSYNVYSGAMESYLISMTEQKVQIADFCITLNAFEPIHLECSHKYLIAEIEAFAKTAGFKLVQHCYDDKNYFVDTLLQVIKD